jgi:excisionase family DNA binding protein
VKLEMTYTVRQLHDMTGVPATTIYEAIHKGHLSAMLLPGTERGYRIKESDAMKFFGGGDSVELERP